MPPYAKNLPLIISKYLAMGLNLYDVIKRVTEIPAKLMGLENKIGTLREGAYADVAIFKLKDHHYIQKDFCDDEIICEKILIPLMTMLSGEIQYCQSDFYL
jgi:predicted amidohydrolase